MYFITRLPSLPVYARTNAFLSFSFLHRYVSLSLYPSFSLTHESCRGKLVPFHIQENRATTLYFMYTYIYTVYIFTSRGNWKYVLGYIVVLQPLFLHWTHSVYEQYIFMHLKTNVEHPNIYWGLTSDSWPRCLFTSKRLETQIRWTKGPMDSTQLGSRV